MGVVLTEGSGGYREDEGEGGKGEGLGHTGGQEDAGERGSYQGNHDWSWEQARQIQGDQGSGKGLGPQRASTPEGSEQRSEDNLVAAMRVGASGQRRAKGHGQASVIIQAGEGDGGWKWLVRRTGSGRENLDLDEKVGLAAQLTTALSKDESAIWGLTDRKAEAGPY